MTINRGPRVLWNECTLLPPTFSRCNCMDPQGWERSRNQRVKETHFPKQSFQSTQQSQGDKNWSLGRLRPSALERLGWQRRRERKESPMQPLPLEASAEERDRLQLGVEKPRWAPSGLCLSKGKTRVQGSRRRQRDSQQQNNQAFRTKEKLFFRSNTKPEIGQPCKDQNPVSHYLSLKGSVPILTAYQKLK